MENSLDSAIELISSVLRELPNVQGDLEDAQLKAEEWLQRELEAKRKIEPAADFKDADLQGADLDFAIQIRADFRGANLRGASLQEASLYEATFEGADLQGANLYKAHLLGTDLQKANLDRADLRGAYLRGANLNNVSLANANLEGADLREVQLSFLDDTAALLKHADLTRAVLDITTEGGKAVFDQSILIGADIYERYSLSQYINCDMRLATFNQCTVSSRFNKCDLRGARFVGCKFDGASFYDCNFRDAVIYRCIAVEGQFHAPSQLTPAQIANIRWIDEEEAENGDYAGAYWSDED
jgi:uncharacterized protein YjbI with pentapeptide repeats